MSTDSQSEASDVVMSEDEFYKFLSEGYSHNNFLYTYENFEQTQHSLSAIEKREPMFTVFDHQRNVLTKRTDSAIFPDGAVPQLFYQSYQTLKDCHDQGMPLFPINIKGVLPEEPKHPFEPEFMEHRRQEFERMKTEWGASGDKASVLNIPSHRHRRIRKIVFFSSESIERANVPRPSEGQIVMTDVQRIVYMQHLMICDIASKLDREYADGERISIVAQAPKYTNNDKLIVNRIHESHPITFVADPRGFVYGIPESHPITFVDDPQGFLEIDETTLIIALSPKMPFRQIVADLLLDSGGCSAGILWTENVRDTRGGWNEDSPRVDTLLEEYERVGKYDNMGLAGLANSALYLKDEFLGG